MHDRVEAPPLLGDALEHCLHLTGLADVEGHDDLCVQRVGQRLDVFLRLLVEIGDGHLGTERAQPSRATPGDRLFVRNADDQGVPPFEVRHDARDVHAVLAGSSWRALPDRSASVWRAIISSSSVGMTYTGTRLSGREINDPRTSAAG